MLFQIPRDGEILREISGTNCEEMGSCSNNAETIPESSWNIGRFSLQVYVKTLPVN